MEGLPARADIDVRCRRATRRRCEIESSIGFTMSLFIGALAFGGGHLLPISKVSILAASLLSGLAGWLLLRIIGNVSHRSMAPNIAD